MNCVDSTKAHHFIVNEDNEGICKKCGLTKTFTYEPIDPKENRRFWEISYELLKEKEYEILNERDDLDEF